MWRTLLLCSSYQDSCKLSALGLTSGSGQGSRSKPAGNGTQETDGHCTTARQRMGWRGWRQVDGQMEKRGAEHGGKGCSLDGLVQSGRAGAAGMHTCIGDRGQIAGQASRANGCLASCEVLEGALFSEAAQAAKWGSLALAPQGVGSCCRLPRPSADWQLAVTGTAGGGHIIRGRMTMGSQGPATTKGWP